MIITGKQPIIPWPDVNRELMLLDGTLGDDVARETFAKFISHNPGFAWELMTGYKLFPYQEILLRSWFKKNFNLNIISRGGAKSWGAAVFCALYPITEPNTQIVIASSGFRRSRAILEQVDVFLKAPDAKLLRQCYPHDLKRKNDEFRLIYGEGGYIIAIPLNENARGFRSSVLIVDEALLVSEEIFRAVLVPFLVARSGIKEMLQIKEMEDFLVEKGMLDPRNRDLLKSTKKIIMLSSASFKFQFLYNLYQEWINKILEGVKKDDKIQGSYFISRLSYESLPNELIDSTIIQEAQGGGMNNSTFQREYAAQFTDDSSGFYSMKKMTECTIPSGQLPGLELKGDPNAKYIMALDSNLSESAAADHHGMSIFKLDYENKAILSVHNYARAGCGFREHALYFYYLLTNFNITAIITDKTGGGMRFISSCNEMVLFKEKKLKIQPWDADFDNEDLVAAVTAAKRTYNPTERKICYGQIFNGESIGRMADNLQIFIDRKKIFFASSLAAQPNVIADTDGVIPAYLYEGENNPNKTIVDFIDEQDDNINLMKSETSLIEVKVTPLGTRMFDLPQHLRRSEAPNRARRDLYTCLKMGTWLSKCMFDMVDVKQEETSLVPTFVR
jgi:hypothetical protein